MSATCVVVCAGVVRPRDALTRRFGQWTWRLDIEYTFAAAGGVDVPRGSHRAYTHRQLVELMESAGFAVSTEEAGTGADPPLTSWGLGSEAARRVLLLRVVGAGRPDAS